MEYKNNPKNYFYVCVFVCVKVAQKRLDRNWCKLKLEHDIYETCDKQKTVLSVDKNNPGRKYTLIMINLFNNY